jgi:hypothetical protein
MDREENEQGATEQTRRRSRNRGSRRGGRGGRHNPRQQGDPRRYEATNRRNLPWWKDSQWWQVIVAAILVPFGIYAVIIYSAQLDAMRDALNPAIAGVEVARNNARLDQRAWVAPASAEGKPTEGNLLSVAVIFKNTGKTFATNVKVRGCLRYRPDATEPDWDKEIESVSPTSAGIMAPNGDYFSQSNTPIPVTEDMMKELDAGRAVYFLFGQIDYSDIFKKPHWTRFCYRLNPKNGTWNAHTTQNWTEEDAPQL